MSLELRENALTNMPHMGGLFVAWNQLSIGMTTLFYLPDPERTLSSLEADRGLYREAGDDGAVAHCTALLGRLAIDLGDIDTARTRFVDVLTAYPAVEDDQLFTYLVWIARTVIGLGSPVCGARLLGAASVIDEAIGSPGCAQTDRDIADVTARARAALGDATYDAAYAEGRAMTKDEAIAYALEEVAPDTGESPWAPE